MNLVCLLVSATISVCIRISFRLCFLRVMELTSRHRQEIEVEGERARAWQAQMEKAAQARERAYKQKTKGLEEQVTKTKERKMWQ